jgi:hypothetical protein
MKRVAIFLALGFLAACGGSQSASSIVPQSAAQSLGHRVSASSGDLLYVSDGREGVRIFTFPQGNFVGTITGLVNERSQCSDVDGNVFITQWGSDSQGGKIVEYAHDGAGPINTANFTGLSEAPSLFC